MTRAPNFDGRAPSSSSRGTSTTRGLSRRRFLRGLFAGGAAAVVGLPLLEWHLGPHGDALADGSAFPVRFGLFFWGNGMLPERWIPAAEGPDWSLSDQLAPLANVKDAITLVTGMEQKTPNEIPHGSGAAGILSGHPLLIRGDRDQTFAAPSIDQVIAAGIGGETRFRSLEFGAEAESGLSYRGPDERNPPESEPLALFERIFGPEFREPGSNTEPDPKLALRRSVLDAVKDDTQRFKRDLGYTDKQRLDAHLEGVRELELRIARLEEDPPDLASCSRFGTTPAATYPDLEGRPQLREKNRIMSDIMAMALACDQTRVFSNFITTPVNDLLLGEASAGHHQLTHDEPGEQPEVHAITVSLMEELAYQIEALRAIPEGEGTLLDNMALLATSEISFGRTHALDEMPLIIAGSACGRLVSGTHIRSNRDNTNQLMLSLIRSMGIVAGGHGGGDGYTETGFAPLEV